jgi:hypothetical protein
MRAWHDALFGFSCTYGWGALVRMGCSCTDGVLLYGWVALVRMGYSCTDGMLLVMQVCCVACASAICTLCCHGLVDRSHGVRGSTGEWGRCFGSEPTGLGQGTVCLWDPRQVLVRCGAGAAT